MFVYENTYKVPLLIVSIFIIWWYTQCYNTNTKTMNIHMTTQLH